MLHECAGTGCGLCRWTHSDTYGASGRRCALGPYNTLDPRQAHPIELGWEKTSVDATVEGLLAEAEAEEKKTTPPLPLPSVSQSRPGRRRRIFGRRLDVCLSLGLS